MSQWVSKKSRGEGGRGRQTANNKDAHIGAASSRAAADADAEADGLEAAAAYEASQSASQMGESQVEELLEDNGTLTLSPQAAAAPLVPAAAAADTAAPASLSPPPPAAAAVAAPAHVTAAAAPPSSDLTNHHSTLEEQVRDLLSGAEEEASGAQLEPAPAQSESASSHSHLQQAAARMLASNLCNTSELQERIEQAAQPDQEERKQSDAPAASASASAAQTAPPPGTSSSSSLPLATPLLIAHVLDELLLSSASSRASSRFSDSVLRGLGLKLGQAVKRSETVRQRKDTLLQQDLHTAAASIQKAMRKVLSSSKTNTASSRSQRLRHESALTSSALSCLLCSC